MEEGGGKMEQCNNKTNKLDEFHITFCIHDESFT